MDSSGRALPVAGDLSGLPGRLTRHAMSALLAIVVTIDRLDPGCSGRGDNIFRLPRARQLASQSAILLRTMPLTP